MHILKRHSIFFHFRSFSFICHFQFRSVSFIFFHFLSFFLFFVFVGRLPHDFLLKLLNIIFWRRLGGYHIGPSFFSLVYFFILVFFFNFFLCFSFFSFVFPFFIFHSFIFLLFSFKKCFFLFQNLWRHSRIPWGKVHILSWLYLLCIGSSSLFHMECAHFGDDQVESHVWWAAGGSSPTFVPESPDQCPR